MSDSIDNGAIARRGLRGLPPAHRRNLLFAGFAVLILVTLGFGVTALELLSSHSARMTGQVSPVVAALDDLSSSLSRLGFNDHPMDSFDGTRAHATAGRLRPLADAFRAARATWLRFTEADLAIDVLQSRQLNRKLAELDELLGRLSGPSARGPEPLRADYLEMQHATLELGELVDRMRRAQIEISRTRDALEMREIQGHIQTLGYLAAIVLVGLVMLAIAYLRQTRRLDRHIGALNAFAKLLSSNSGIPLFETMVETLGRQLGYAYVFIGQLSPDDPQQVDTLAVYAHGKLAGNISYRLPGTPCENVLMRRVCFYPSGVQQAFPDDRLLQEMGVESYAGTALLDARDQPIGILVLLDSHPMDPAAAPSSLVQIVASRAETEIERIQAEVQRTSLLEGLEARVEARTTDLRRINAQLEEEVQARREMERDLEDARTHAERGNRAKGEFLANASHEIRTHINGLLGMLSLLEDGNMEGEQLEYVEMAHASGDVLLALINDLLDYSKIEAGQLTIEAVDFNLDRLIGEVNDLFGVRARSSGLTLETEVDVGLPREFRGDVVRIRQVLCNLVDNALKFTGEGGVVVRVIAEGGAYEDGTLSVRFEVEDTGIGIDADKREELFAPFAQADGSITRRYGGTGLGLAICAQLVRLLGGEIDVDGAQGLGARFWFVIPLRPAQGDDATCPSTARDSLEGLRVLVVDDSAVSRAYLRSLLGAWHVDCEAVSGGHEALERLHVAAGQEARPFELVLLDRLMPEMDGIELAERISSAPDLGHPWLVMVTRYGGSVAADEALRSGIAGYLNKPVSPSQLFDTLVRVTGLQARVHRPRVADGGPRSGRILVVEDNLVNQKVAVGMLRKLGYQADAVDDGQKALGAVRRVAYDLVLMDCQMPIMDGYTATAEIRAQEPPGTRLPIVAMTAHALGGEREKCLAMGMDDYLAKPVRFADLKQKVDYWCLAGADDEKPAAAPETGPAAGSAGSAAGAEVPQPAGDAVDRATLDELHEVMGEGINELIDAYLGDTVRRLQELRQAVDGQPEVLVSVAHTLKGSSANVGAKRFSERCSAVHQRAKRDASDPGLRDLIGALAIEFEQVRSALEAYRAGL